MSARLFAALSLSFAALAGCDQDPSLAPSEHADAAALARQGGGGGTYVPADQLCAPGEYVDGFDASGVALCSVPAAPQHGVFYDDEAWADMGTANTGAAVEITVVDRNEDDTMYVYRCQKVNLSVTVCVDVLTGVSMRHISFVEEQEVLFARPGFEIVSYLDGRSPFGASVGVRSLGHAVAWDLRGGL